MNHSISPFIPQLERYQKSGTKPELPPNYYQPLPVLYQPIPSIVVNPHPHELQPDRSGHYVSQESLPVPDLHRKLVPHGSMATLMPPVYTPIGPSLLGMRSAVPNPPNYAMDYVPLHGHFPQPQIYYVPHGYPHFRPPIFYPESYHPMGSVGVKVPSEVSRFPIHNAPIRALPGPTNLPAITQNLGITAQPEVTSQPGLTHQHAVLVYKSIGHQNPKPVALVESKTYKPTRTKKNSRPKINKIVGDMDDVRMHSERKARFEIGECSLDMLYEHCREALGLQGSREDISRTCECALPDALEKRLFEMFVENLVLFIDVFLAHDMFQKVFSELALYDDSRMILNSMFCLSSLILQRTHPEAIDPLCPLKYYELTVTSIRFHLSLPEVENPESGILARCLLSTCLLCIYELFFVAVDSTYIKGAGSIFMSILSKKNKTESLLKSSPFYETCFWAMFICDMILSKKLHMPNMYSFDKVWSGLEPDYFGDLDNYAAFQEEPKTIKESLNNYYSVLVSRHTTIWWQHKIVLIVCSINDFMLLTDVISREDFHSNKRYFQWQQLINAVDEYDRNMPVYLKPLIHLPCSKDRVFPVLFFKDEYTAVAAIHFKLAKLALVEALYENVVVEFPSILEPEYAKYPPSSREKIAKDILGILQTYDSNRRIWPVCVHSLRQASKWIPEGTEAHRELKVLASRVLQFSMLGLRLLVVNDS